MNRDHREHVRAPLSGVVKLFEWDRSLEAQAREISASGLFLRTESSLCEGSMVTLRVALPGRNRPFTVLAKVVRTVKGGALRHGGMGLQFVDITPSDRRRIDEYVSQRTLQAA